MSLPIVAVLWLAGLVVSARTHITATLGGAQVSIPVLGVVAVAVVLALAAGVLVAARLLLRDGLRLQPRMATR